MQRRVRLPESADMQKIKAAYNNGTLTLDIPKAEVRRPSIPYLSHACPLRNASCSAFWLL